MSEEDVFKLLGDRLALSRLKKSQFSAKQQKILDNAARFCQYKGFQVNGGALVETTGGISKKSLITNGLILPDKVIRVIGNSADQMPRHKTSDKTSEKETLYLDVVKEIVGSSDSPSNFEFSLEFEGVKKMYSPTIKILETKDNEGINSAFARVKLKFIGKYKLAEENQRGHYFSFSVAQPLEQSQPKGKGKAYLCNCKPKTIHKFISRSGIVNDLTRFFYFPQPALIRTKCEELEKLLDSNLEPKEKNNEVATCKALVRWRLVEVGVGVVEEGYNGIYAEGIVGENGILKLPQTYGGFAGQGFIVDFLTKKIYFGSSYNYNGYMQLQVGCHIKGDTFWKPTKGKSK